MLWIIECQLYSEKSFEMQKPTLLREMSHQQNQHMTGNTFGEDGWFSQHTEKQQFWSMTSVIKAFVNGREGSYHVWVPTNPASKFNGVHISAQSIWQACLVNSFYLTPIGLITDMYHHNTPLLEYIQESNSPSRLSFELLEVLLGITGRLTYQGNTGTTLNSMRLNLYIQYMSSVPICLQSLITPISSTFNYHTVILEYCTHLVKIYKGTYQRTLLCFYHQNIVIRPSPECHMVPPKMCQ